MKRLFKRSLSMLGVLVMVFTMLPAGMVSVSADTTDFDLPAGYTLQAISTVDELKAIQTGSAAKKVYYYLANNIEITSDTFGIGSNETTDAFWDILDGNGYAITFSGSTGNGVALNGNGIWNGGLFFAMNGDAVVKNLTIKGVITSSAKSVGAIVGQMVSGTIDHCVNHADIQSPQESAGGLAGRVKEGVVVNCMNYGDITGAAFTGGIVGSVSYATAMTEDEIAAGVVKAVIANCANFGTVTGAEKVGGIIGLGSKDKSYRIDNCYNAGSVPEPSLTKDRVGAIVCSAWSGAVITNNCYALENSSPKMLSTTTKMTQAEMQAASFADTLNANVTTGISYINTVGGTSVIVPAVAWQANEGEYPTIPAVTPIIPKADLTEEEQMAMICQKLTAYFMEQDTFDDGATAGKCYTSKAGDYLAIQQADGSWADVDYYCTQSAANGGIWEPYLALDRMQAMAMAYANEQGEWYHDDAMLQGVENAFTYWASIRDANPDKDDYEGPWSTNWWENGNGVQLRFGRIGVVLLDVLSDESKGVILRKLDLNGSADSGQNALWCTQNALYRALVAEDAVQFKKVVDNNLAVNLRIGGLTDEAIQVDYTFHAHGNQLYTNGYGKSLFRDMSFWIDTLAGTDFALPQSVIELMGHYMLDGTRWMIYGDLLEVSLGYTAADEGGYADVYIEPIKRMIKNDPERAAEYRQLLDTITGDSDSAYNGLSGNNYMWTSVLMSQMREGYGVNVRMVNKDMKSTEWRATWPEDAEETGNLLFWTADSTTSVAVDGDEYYTVYGVYDWRHIPGVTSPYALASHYGFDNGSTDAWGVSNGQQGATAYTYNKHDGTNKRTQGKIGTFFFDDEYVALGAGINSNHASAIHTTINQTKSGGDATINGVVIAAGTDDATYTADYVYNNKIGYIFPEATEVHISDMDQTDLYPSIWGTGYRQFGEQLNPDEVPETAEDVFSLWIDHGVAPKDSAYAYIVLPNATEAEVAAYSQNNQITIIANTDKVQAVRHEGLKQTQINFYEAGSVEYAAGKTVSVDGPCSLIIDESGDETMISEAVSNTLSAQSINVVIETADSLTTTKFCSLEEPYAGKTITLAEGGNSLIQSGDATANHGTEKAFDKNLETYWESTDDNAWISYDMQEIRYVGDMIIRWGDQYATAYQLQYSEDGINWTTTYTQQSGQGGMEVVPYNTIGRYWRLLCTASSGDAYQIDEISFNTSGNMALNKPVEVSYTYSEDKPGSYIVDGDATTRWAGERSVNTNWVVVDLGMDTRIDAVRILWENAYSSEYTIDVSDDGTTWTTVQSVTSDGGSDQTALTTSTTGRYLRIQGVKAALYQYGMSIWELEVYGEMELDSDNVAADREVVDASAAIQTTVTDGDTATVWSTDNATDALTLDLGETHQIDSVSVTWGDRYATDYVWQVSMDGDQWSDAVTVSQGTGSTETATIATNARYLRLVLNQSNGTGYDVAELAVYGVAVSDMNPDKAALKKAIDLYVRSDVYTKDSYAAYQEALAAATNIYASEKVTQKQVDAALEDLNTAYAALTFRDFGEVLATVKGQTVNVGSRQTISVNWTQLDKSLDLSGEDLDKIYLFATVDITSDTEAAGMFGNGRVLLRSPNTTKEDGGSQENNAWVNTNTMLTQLGRNVLYFPLSQLVNQTGTMDWSQVQTFRMYIDSMNQFDGNKTMVLGDVQIIRTTEPTKVKVACVGDSITAGVGASATSQNYVSQLQKLLGTGYVVQNFGNSGKTLLKDAAGGNGYVLTDTYQKSIDFEPDVVTIMLGTNDSKDENWNTLSGNYEQELRNLITTYRNLPSHPIVILATSPTAYNRNWNINDAVITDEIAPIQRKVAEEMGCPLIETNANTKNMADNFADGIHPNDGGHTVLAELFADGITDAATRIYSFELAGQTATVDHDKGTIAVTLSADADVTDLTPTIGLMMSATVSPAGSMDFTDSVTLTVTAPDGENTREYLVTVTKETGTILLGDVNLNGEVTAEDALMALQAATDKIALTADQTTAANVDETDDVTAGDALLILQYATKKIASF